MTLLLSLVVVLLVGGALLWLATVAMATPTVAYRIDCRFDVRSTEFLHALSSVLPVTIMHGNRIERLENGARFYPEMLAAVAAAQRSIALECYIFDRGSIGDAFIAAVCERARAGVRVRLILDRFGSRRFRDACQLTEAGCHIGWHPLARWRRAHWLTNSTHREILVVDGRVAFTGGAGISDWWARPVDHRSPWRDTMVRVEGPVVSSLQAVFAENWLECRGEIVAGDEWFPVLEPRGGMTAFVVRNSPGSAGCRALFQALVECASREIRLATPYFLPDPSFLAALIDRARRGVSVTILVPGSRMDHRWVRFASRRLFAPLLEAGVRLFEYQPSMLHQKLMVVDGYWSVVGTTNIDILSFQYLDEVNLAVLDEPFAAELQAQHDVDLARSVELTLPAWRRPRWEAALADAAWAASGQDWVHHLRRRPTP
jgi:cardiolipin synthase